MSQDAIWDYYQTESLEAFSDASGRLEFLARRLEPNQRVLNIGVGSGELERMGAKRGAEMWSLDPSERAITRLSNDLNMGDRARVGYSQKMPFPDQLFDVVIMSEVLEHLDQDVLPASLLEVQRVLRPGGRFIGTVPADEDLNTAHVICPNCESQFHRWGHQRSFGVDSLRMVLESRFDVQAVEEHFFIRWDNARWKQRAAGIVKKLLSSRRIGPYGTHRNIYFQAVRVPDARGEQHSS